METETIEAETISNATISAMAWSVELLPGRVFRLVTHGSFSLECIREMLHELIAHPQWRPGRDLIADHRDLDFGLTSMTDLRIAARIHRRLDAHVGDGRIALLMGNTFSYSMGRFLQLISEAEVSAELKVFDDPAKAESWIRDHVFVPDSRSSRN